MPKKSHIGINFSAPRQGGGMAAADNPVLLGPRLRLDPFSGADEDAVTALFAAPEVRRFLSVGAMSPVTARRFAAEFIGQSQDELREAGFAALAVRRCDPADGKTDAASGTASDASADAGTSSCAIGYCGLRPLPDRISAAELVFALSPDHWGQGLAREAVGLTLEWARTRAGLREVLALARPEHARSRAVMAATGMQYAGETARYYGETLALYRLPLRPVEPADTA